MKPAYGVVYLIGAGPGDPGLMTVRGMDVLRRADVVFYDRLVSREILDACKPDVKLIDVGKAPGRKSHTQSQINKMLVEFARAHRIIARLKGGDPFVFGRGYEEVLGCRDAGVPCVAIPGVSSAISAPAMAGVPVTHRAIARSFAVVTGKVDGIAIPPHDYGALAKVDTLILMMCRSNLQKLTEALMTAGHNPDTPATSIASASTSKQQIITGTLATIAHAIQSIPRNLPLTTIIGVTAGFADSPSHPTGTTLEQIETGGLTEDQLTPLQNRTYTNQ